MKFRLHRLVFLILALAFVALGWMTYSVLRLEKEEYKAARLAYRDDAIRQSLSRINSFMFRFIDGENNRPLFQKGAAGTQSLRHIQSKPDFVRFHFAVTPDGELLRIGEDGQAAAPALETRKEAPPLPPYTESNLPHTTTSPQKLHPLVHETPFLPHWQGNDLVFLKQVPSPQGSYTFAIWVDWARLKKQLLSEISGILPHADIQTYLTSKNGDPLLSLATLPARLVPGEYPEEEMPLFSTLRIGILLVWLFILIGSGGLMALLVGTARLSERRADFVSAVTHELRTPLTNFSLYTEMLDEGLVPESKKPDYFRLLRAEAARLIHLVENVLAYSRIEKRSNDHHLETFDAKELFDSLAHRLRDRLDRENTGFRYRLDPSANGHSLVTDKTAVEQILDNLVDNSLKYGVSPEPEISLEITHHKNTFLLHYRDNGPGIDPAQKKDLFSPFTRSAEAAAGHKPGVGLGLALARDTARMLKGDLSLLYEKKEQGVHFLLTLPSL